MGCYVPASKCMLTPVDMIFTRIGASDRILEGKSTFFVEMEETNNILRFATSKSLVIMDELGRGTSTFDGYALAHAVLAYVTSRIRCMTLFSTHYHMLLESFREVKGVAAYHMGCEETEQGVRFRYKFEPGEAKGSFGLNVARMAGVPEGVVERARVKGEDMDRHMGKRG